MSEAKGTVGREAVGVQVGHSWTNHPSLDKKEGKVLFGNVHMIREMEGVILQ